MNNLYLLRHGETEWALAGKHTGRTDIQLTDRGRQQAQSVTPSLANMKFAAVFTSPLTRARETAKIAGFPDATVCDDLAEVDYGAYEGKTSKEIRETVPNWTVWSHPCPNGETLEQAAKRAANVIKLATATEGDVLLVSHGHMLRVLTATWLQLPPSEGRHFMLDTARLCILTHERESPAIRLWNADSLPAAP